MHVYGLRFTIRTLDTTTVPAFGGPLAVTYASPVPTVSATAAASPPPEPTLALRPMSGEGPVSDPQVGAPDDDLIPFASEDVAPRPRGRGRRIADGVALTLRTAGELAMTAGFVILLFVVYELYFTGIATQHAQHQLEKQFTASIRAGTPPVSAPGSPAPALGSGIAVIYAPRLGSSWKFVVVEGTGTDQLAKGPGHWDYDPGLAKALGLFGRRHPVAVPVAGPSGVRYAVNASVPVHRMSTSVRSTIVTALTDAAEQLSQLLV